MRSPTHMYDLNHNDISYIITIREKSVINLTTLNPYSNPKSKQKRKHTEKKVFTPTPRPPQPS